MVKLDEKQNELYIPSNVKTRLEFFKGYGVKEMVITLIVMAFSLSIAFGIYAFKGTLAAVIFLFVVVAGTVISVTKDENNMCVAKQVGYMMKNSKMQKKYRYNFFDKWHEKFLSLPKNSKEKTCNDEINVKDIRNNFLYTNDNKIICYLKIHPLNLYLLSNKEKKSIKNQLAAELSSETKPMKFFSIARPVEVTSVVDELRNMQEDCLNQVQKKLLRQHLNDLLKLTFTGDRVERQLYLIIWQDVDDYAEKDLLKRAMDLSNKFNTCSIKTEILSEQQIIQLCSSFTNITGTYKEDSDYEDYMPIIREG